MLSFKAKRQPFVALSTTEAEWVGIVFAKEAVALQRTLSDMGLNLVKPPMLHNDNLGALSWCVDPTHLHKRRHIRLRRAHAEQCAEDGLIDDTCRVRQKNVLLIFLPSAMARKISCAYD